MNKNNSVNVQVFFRMPWADWALNSTGFGDRYRHLNICTSMDPIMGAYMTMFRTSVNQSPGDMMRLIIKSMKLKLKYFP